MRSFILFLCLLFSSIMLTSQTPFTATYTFGSNGNVASFVYNGTNYDGVSFSDIAKVGVTTSNNNNNFRATDWPLGASNGSDVFTGTLDEGKYIGFTITAESGYKFTITSISFGVGRSAAGVRQWQWRSSTDNYATPLDNYGNLPTGLTNNAGVLQNTDSNSSWTTVLNLGTGYSDLETSMGFRLYGYNSESNTGTAGLQGPITITGTFEETNAQPPVWNAGFPRIDNVEKNSLDLLVNINKVGTAYYLVVEDGVGQAPSTVQDIIDANNSIAIAAANTEYTEQITGLNAGTAYSIYVVAQDNAATPNVQTTFVTLNETTLSQSDQAEILTYSLPGELESEITDGAIEVKLPTGTDVTDLIATFTTSEDITSIMVNGVPQVSGTTTMDFTNPVTYVVTAEDNTTTKNWVVTVVMPSSDATISSTDYTIDNSGETITGIPYYTSISTFKSNLTPAENATFEVYESNGSTIATEVLDGYKVIVTAEDQTTTKTYTIQMTTPIGDLFFSEYIEGSSQNKAFEIYNGTGVAVDLSVYSVKIGSNGNSFANSTSLQGVLANGEVFIIAHSSAKASITSIADMQLSTGITTFNGDDALGLFKNDILIDIIGEEGVRPSNGWNVAGTTTATLDHTLIRKSTITTGNTDWTTSAGTNAEDSEWVVYPNNYIGGLGSHNQPLLSDEANITDFNVGQDQVDVNINDENHTVSIGLKSGTDRSSLTPTITISTGATINPASGVAQDFSSNVTYTVTAEGENTQSWTAYAVVYSNVATLSDIKVNDETIDGFDPENETYNVELACGTTEIPVVTYTLSQENAIAVKTDATVLPGATTIVVTSQDETVEKTYTINFTVSTELEEEITITTDETEAMLGCNTSIDLIASSEYATYIWSNGATTNTITISASGVITVTVTDINGCVGFASYTVVEDNTPVTADITASEEGSDVNLTASGGVKYLWSTGSTTATITVSAVGDYSVTVTGANGCTGTASHTVEETILLTITSPADGTTVNVDEVTIGFTVANFEITGASADGKVMFKIGEGTYADATVVEETEGYSTLISGLTEGENVITLALADENGDLIVPNVTDEITITYEAPSTDPELTITSPADGTTVNVDEVSIAFTVTNFEITGASADGKVMFKIGEGTYADATVVEETEGYSTLISGLAEGENVITLALADENGDLIVPNVTDEITITYEAPSTDPELTITSPADGTTVNVDEVTIGFTVANFEITGASADGKVMFKIGEGTYADATVVEETEGYSTLINGLAEGENVITLALADENGDLILPNVTDEITITYEAPSTDPELTITSPADGTTVNVDEVTIGFTVANFEITGASADGKVMFKIGEGTYADATVVEETEGYSTLINGLAEGENVITLALADENGDLIVPNVTDEITITYEAPSTDPALTITSPADGSSVDVDEVTIDFTVANFEITGASADGKVMFKIGEGTYADATVVEETEGYSTLISGLTEGENVITLALADENGDLIVPNVTDEITINFAVREPSLVITSPGNGVDVNTDEVMVTYTIEDFILGTHGKVAYKLNDGTISYTTDNSVLIQGLTEGNNTIHLQLVDMNDAAIVPEVSATLSVNYVLEITFDETETFTKSNATGNYTNGAYVGDNFITWNYVAVKDALPYVINDKGVTLHNASESHLESESISGGIGSFELRMRKALTGNAPRQLEVYVNDVLKGTSGTIGGFYGVDDNSYIFRVDNINVEGNVTIKVKIAGNSTSNTPITIDDVKWTRYEQNDPYIRLASDINMSTEYNVTSLDIPFNANNFNLGTDGKVKYILNGGTPVLLENETISLTNLVSGTYNVAMELVTNSNASLQPAVTSSFSFTVENTPVLTITSPENGAELTQDAVQVSFEIARFILGTDGKVEYMLNGNSKGFVQNTNPINISGFEDGENTINLRLVNMSNQPIMPEISSSVVVVYDAPIVHEHPTLKIVDPEEEVVETTMASISVTVEVENFIPGIDGRIKYRLNNGESNNSISTTIIFSNLVHGENNLYLELVDMDGQSLDPEVKAGLRVIYDSKVGISQVDVNNVNIYPNPATDYVVVELNRISDKISVVNAIGQVVREIVPTSEKTQINISDLESGIYMINILNSNESESFKIIVK